MVKYNEDNKYLNIVQNILDNKEFSRIKDIEHHGTTRYEHSLKVSYYSYLIATKMNLNSVEVARAGLLHDFFLSDKNRTAKDRIVSSFTHPKYALENTRNNFNISAREENIIRSHMFPMTTKIPKYREAWLVSFVDKAVAISEFKYKVGYKLIYALNLYLLFLINYIK